MVGVLKISCFDGNFLVKWMDHISGFIKTNFKFLLEDFLALRLWRERGFKSSLSEKTNNETWHYLFLSMINPKKTIDYNRLSKKLIYSRMLW